MMYYIEQFVRNSIIGAQPVIKNIVIDSNKIKTGIIFFIVIVFSLIIEFDKLDSDCRAGRLDWLWQQWLVV